MRFIGILFIVCKISSRAEGKQEREPLFNLKVLSVLSSKFLACHGESFKKIKRELKLILQTGFLKSCESQEPSLVTGQSPKSPFYLAATRQHENDWAAMPPKKNDKLSVTQLSARKHSVELGAHWSDVKKQVCYNSGECANPTASERGLIETNGGLSNAGTYSRYRHLSPLRVKAIESPVV